MLLLVFAAMLLACGDAAGDPLRLIEGPTSMHREAARARFARALAQEIEATLQRLGPADAAEREAVAAELAAIDRLRDRAALQVRAQRLYESPSFQHIRLVNTLSAVHDALECAASPFASTRKEMSCWGIVAAYLGERELYEEGLSVLLRSGRLRYAAGMTQTRWLLQPRLWSRYAAAVQDYITLPYLRGSLD